MFKVPALHSFMSDLHSEQSEKSEQSEQVVIRLFSSFWIPHKGFGAGSQRLWRKTYTTLYSSFFLILSPFFTP